MRSFLPAKYRPFLGVLLVVVMILGYSALASSPVNSFSDAEKTATPADQSRFFHVSYRVLRASDASAQSEKDSDPSKWFPITIRIDMENISDKPLENIIFTTLYPEAIKNLLFMETPYNEPITLYPAAGTKAPNGLSHAWSTFLSRERLRANPQAAAADFSNLVLKITWKGGTELIRITPDNAIGQDAESKEPLSAPLTDSDLMAARQL